MQLNSASQLFIFATSFSLIIFITIIASIYIIKVKSYKSSLDLTQSLHEEKERTMQFAAMEVHDHFTQMLCMSRMTLHVINDHAVPENRHEITVLTQMVEKMITASHNLIHSLYPGELDAQGLLLSIKEEIDWINTINESNIYFSCSGQASELGHNNALMAFRILQESLSNALKHSRASSITVTSHYDLKGFELIINDNGIGFELETTLQSRFGNGLRNLYKRAEISNGSLKIQTAHNKGTIISFYLENKI